MFKRIVLCVCVVAACSVAQARHRLWRVEPDRVQQSQQDQSAPQLPADGKYSLHPTVVAMQAEAQRVGCTSQLDESLCATAQAWAVRMARWNDLNHGRTAPSAEIIAKGQSDVPEVFNDWMHSRGHRAILMTGYSRCGWGLAYSASGQPFWCGQFAR